MCRKPDSLVTFYLLYFYIYGVLFSCLLLLLLLFVVLKDETTLKM